MVNKYKIISFLVNYLITFDFTRKKIFEILENFILLYL